MALSIGSAEDLFGDDILDFLDDTQADGFLSDTLFLAPSQRNCSPSQRNPPTFSHTPLRRHSRALQLQTYKGLKTKTETKTPNTPLILG